nr:MAG TPA: hypothetical protein [Caudoviricetes sp.]
MNQLQSVVMVSMLSILITAINRNYMKMCIRS